MRPTGWRPTAVRSFFAKAGLLLLALPTLAFARSDALFTAEELRWMEAHPVVRIAVDPDWQPFEYVKDGVYMGLAAEYIAAVSRISGLRFELVDGTRWGYFKDAILAHEADVLPTVAYGLLAEEIRSRVVLSTPYFVGTLVIVTRESQRVIFDLSQLSGKTVALKGGGAYERMLRERHHDVRLLPTRTPGEALAAVRDGRADAAIGLDANLLPLVRRQHPGRLFVSGTLASTTAVIAMATRNDLPELASIINKSLGSLTARETDEMVAKWLETTDYGAPSWQSIARYYAVEISAGLLLLGVLALFALRARMQHRLLAESEERKSRFIAMMSHEIRTPLNAVVSAIELLSRSNLPPMERQLADTAIKASGSLVSMLDDVLDISRLEAGKVQLERVASNIRVMVESVVWLMQAQLDAKRLALRLEIDTPDDLNVFIDPTRIRQVLFNLLSNAIKFTEAGTISVTVRLAMETPSESARPMLHIAVRDTGVGIPASRQQHLFRAFEQATASTTRRYGGSGLGLSICKELVTLMGGAIRLESQEGKGTAVSLSIPVSVSARAAHEPDGGGPPGAPDAANGVRPLVLVVDDHPTNLEMIHRQLAALHCDAELVDSGEAALRAATKGEYALMLLDCNLPDMDGYTVAKRLRTLRDRALPRLPIIAISALTGDAHAARCLESGMDGTLSKPLTLETLASIIERWCQAPRRPLRAPAAATARIRDEQELRMLFAQSCRDDMQGLLSAIAEHRHDDARLFAHRLKGAGLTMQHAPVSAAAQALEAALESGNPATVRTAADALRSRIDAL